MFNCFLREPKFEYNATQGILPDGWLANFSLIVVRVFRRSNHRLSKVLTT